MLVMYVKKYNYNIKYNMFSLPFTYVSVWPASLPTHLSIYYINDLLAFAVY